MYIRLSAQWRTLISGQWSVWDKYLTVHLVFPIPKGATFSSRSYGRMHYRKTFTLDKNLPGPDHLASSSPSEFREMVKHIRDVELAMGSFLKTVSKSEQGTMSVARKFITSKKTIEEGENFSTDNICVKRGNGTEPPIRLYDFLGKRSKNHYEIDDGINE